MSVETKLKSIKAKLSAFEEDKCGYYITECGVKAKLVDEFHTHQIIY